MSDAPETTTAGTEHYVVVDVPAHQRFELLDGDEVLGYADYRELGGERVELPHTVISPTRRGQGLGDVLVAEIVRRLDERGATIVPSCWFVADYLERHPQGRG